MITTQQWHCKRPHDYVWFKKLLDNPKDKVLVRLFVIFMQKNNAWDIFLEYLQRRSKTWADMRGECCTKIENLIYDAFGWNCGRFYRWGTLSMAWIEICKEFTENGWPEMRIINNFKVYD